MHDLRSLSADAGWAASIRRTGAPEADGQNKCDGQGACLAWSTCGDDNGSHGCEEAAVSAKAESVSGGQRRFAHSYDEAGPASVWCPCRTCGACALVRCLTRDELHSIFSCASPTLIIPTASGVPLCEAAESTGPWMIVFLTKEYCE